MAEATPAHTLKSSKTDASAPYVSVANGVIVPSTLFEKVLNEDKKMPEKVEFTQDVHAFGEQLAYYLATRGHEQLPERWTKPEKKVWTRQVKETYLRRAQGTMQRQALDEALVCIDKTIVMWTSRASERGKRSVQSDLVEFIPDGFDKSKKQVRFKLCIGGVAKV